MSDYLSRIPAFDQDLSVFTFEDAVESVLDAFNVQRTEWELRTARRAVIDAYRDLPNARRWRYFLRQGKITTVVPQTTGTIVYDHTGGASERLVTLTGATWPEDAHLYELLIGDVRYKVEDYKSTTTITLTQDSNPGADVASTTYKLVKAKYALPVNYRRGSALVELDNVYWPRYVDPDALLHSMVDSIQPQEPDFYTIRGGGEHYGGLVVEFSPPPSSARTYDFAYEARPRPLRYERYDTGTVAVSGTTVTGTGTQFEQGMVGSQIRFPYAEKANELPTGIAGSVEGHNPYEFQRTIMSVASATSATLDFTPGTITSTRYTISDPIDIEQDAMLSAFKRLCETNYARYTSKEDRHERSAVYQKSLREAAEADTRYGRYGTPWHGHHDPRITITTANG